MGLAGPRSGGWGVGGVGGRRRSGASRRASTSLGEQRGSEREAGRERSRGVASRHPRLRRSRAGPPETSLAWTLDPCHLLIPGPAMTSRDVITPPGGRGPGRPPGPLACGARGTRCIPPGPLGGGGRTSSPWAVHGRPRRRLRAVYRTAPWDAGPGSGPPPRVSIPRGAIASHPCGGCCGRSDPFTPQCSEGSWGGDGLCAELGGLGGGEGGLPRGVPVPGYLPKLSAPPSELYAARERASPPE